MRILGIDPGLSTAGLGFLHIGPNRTIIETDWLTIKTPTALPLEERLFELHENLTEYLEQTKPDLAVVEQLFFTTNKRTAMDTSAARGVILLTLRTHATQIISATPLQLKMSITGDGHADKKQVQEMVKRILKLNEIPSPPDAADALALALFGAYSRKAIC
ncbi:MAG: crossover junction endodeoxyribonuclease RuvC [Candidatus Peribacteraceae bacterium]|nr:crossover junction endodeoxyribonuclease RuvC [Candidatus Peribacteraceae bacterium]